MSTSTLTPQRGVALVIGILLTVGILALINLSSDSHGEDKSDSSSDVGYEPPPVKDLRLTLAFDEGSIISHDVYLTNTSGEDLTEVRLHIQLVGENASPVIDRYWTRWDLGVRQDISIPVEQVKNVQRLFVSGTADQGRIDQGWNVK